MINKYTIRKIDAFLDIQMQDAFFKITTFSTSVPLYCTGTNCCTII